LMWSLKLWADTRSVRVVKEIAARVAFEALPPLEKLAAVAFDDVNSCIRKSVWETLPFPHAKFGEDIAWGLQVIRAGCAIVYEPRARVLHSHNDSLWRRSKRAHHNNRNRNSRPARHTSPPPPPLPPCPTP